MCLSDNTLIKLLADELPPPQRQQSLEHINACASCQARYQQLQATWDLLGHWQITSPARDLAPTILAAAHRPSAGRRWVSAAAAILLAATAGVVAGLAVPRASPGHLAHHQAATEQALQTAGLDALAGETVVFAPLFVPPSPDDFDPQEPQL